MQIEVAGFYRTNARGPCLSLPPPPALPHGSALPPSNSRALTQHPCQVIEVWRTCPPPPPTYIQAFEQHEHNAVEVTVVNSAQDEAGYDLATAQL